MGNSGSHICLEFFCFSLTCLLVSSKCYISSTSQKPDLHTINQFFYAAHFYKFNEYMYRFTIHTSFYFCVQCFCRFLPYAKLLKWNDAKYFPDFCMRWSNQSTKANSCMFTVVCLCEIIGFTSNVLYSNPSLENSWRGSYR